MLKDLLRYSLRSFKRQRSSVIINILGLSIGIACSLLIAIFVLNEAGYDNYNRNGDRIYRMVLNGKIGGQEITYATSAAVMGPTMIKEFPEVEAFLRMTGRGPTIIEYGDQTFTEEDMIEADSTFFDFFSIPVLKGDPENLLNAPRRVVISESTATKIFGDQDPIDKTIYVSSDTVGYIISGVMSDIPENTHFRANIISSFMTNPRSNSTVWLSNSFSTYIMLRPNVDYKTVDNKIPALIEKYVGPEVQQYMGISLEEFTKKGDKYRFFMQKLKDIHLDPSIQNEFREATDPKYLYIFGSISVMIVLIAAINFMNLATAQASRRSREVGIKKVSGSTRTMLMTQFLTESFVLSIVSMIIALVIVSLSIPNFNKLLDANLNLNLLSNWYIIPSLLLSALIISLLSGIYPAFFLSSFTPCEVLKGSYSGGSGSGRLRKVLVVFQFTVSVLLITGTLVMYRQINFMLNKDVGFNKEQLMVINRGGALGNRVEAFKTSIMEIPGIVNISSSTAVPGRNNNNNGYMIEGRKDETFLMTTNWIDFDYVDTYEMEIIKGRTFSKEYSSDMQACVINESAAQQFGISDIEGTRFMQPGGANGELTYHQVIGIVKNFNFESLRNPVQPYVFLHKPDDFRWGYITIRLSSADFRNTISEIESRWKEFTSNDPLQYYFVDEDFEQMYIQEKRNAKMAVIFSILAIFVAALGLFGLTAFTVEQRTKEIGVRKAMGSSSAAVYLVISREIFILVSIAALIAWPLIYIIAQRWLENFYYRIDPGFISFAGGLLIALGTAIFTVSYRIIKAASVNPAQSLKYE